MVIQEDSVHWGRTLISYSVEFFERKTLAISVHPDLSVSVKAPLHTELEVVREKVLKRAAWIQRQWREFELYLPKQPPRSYVNGETHRYLGRQYRLRAEQGATQSVKCLRGYFRVTLCDEPTPEKVRCLLERWYRERAGILFRERLRICLRRAVGEGIREPQLRIQRMRNRWGSCSAKGRIILNLELIKAPTECIDYVIFHELCHLRERHHGPRFWRLLAKLMPDYEQRRKRLNLFADV